MTKKSLLCVRAIRLQDLAMGLPIGRWDLMDLVGFIDIILFFLCMYIYIMTHVSTSAYILHNYNIFIHNYNIYIYIYLYIHNHVYICTCRYVCHYANMYLYNYFSFYSSANSLRGSRMWRWGTSAPPGCCRRRSKLSVKCLGLGSTRWVLVLRPWNGWNAGKTIGKP